MKRKTALLSLITVSSISISHAGWYVPPIKVNDKDTYNYVILALLDSSKADYTPLSENNGTEIDRIKRCWQIDAIRTRLDFINLNKEFSSELELSDQYQNTHEKVIANNLKVVGNKCK